MATRPPQSTALLLPRGLFFSPSNFNIFHCAADDQGIVLRPKWDTCTSDRYAVLMILNDRLDNNDVFNRVLGVRSIKAVREYWTGDSGITTTF